MRVVRGAATVFPLNLQTYNFGAELIQIKQTHLVKSVAKWGEKMPTR